MPAVHVRNVPESTLAALRERAEQHGHSMQQELLEILQAAAAVPLPRPAQTQIQLVTAHTDGRSTWRREDLYDDEGR